MERGGKWRESLMLAFDFDYYLPDTLQEAVDIYATVQNEGKRPFYYGGGTEILSMSRVFNLRPDAVIDIKNIPECSGIGTDGSRLIFGAASTLSAIQEADLFPLLSLAASRIADHTIQCKLTLGGNLAGTIIYREMLLPLLLADSTIEIFGPMGSRCVPIADVFLNGKMLTPGELFVKANVDIQITKLKYFHIKKSKTEKIGYPLISLCAVYSDGDLRLAASGLCEYPFRFNDTKVKGSHSAADMAEQLAAEIPAPVLDDLEGSAGYRLFIFKKTVERIIIESKKNGGNIHA
jgi:CO/xanthine dehydrogenase FAD-binding subunit